MFCNRFMTSRLFQGFLCIFIAFLLISCQINTEKEQTQEVNLTELNQDSVDFSALEIEEPQEQEDPQEFLSRTLWHEPYIIFQASEGETISDHFLMALDTQQGKLHRIHQGYHARFWIQDTQLYFLHIDQYYTCPLSHWDQLSNIPPPDLDQARASLEYTLSTDLPSDLQVIEWANLHQVLQGSFTQPDQNQLLLISGRKEGYFLALYSMHPAPFELIWHERLVREMPPGYGPELMFNFQQVIMEDLDQNGCQEVIIHGEYDGMTTLVDDLILIKLSHPQSNQKVQYLPDPAYEERISTKGSLKRLTPRKIQWIITRSYITNYIYNLSLDSNLKLVLSDPIEAEKTRDISNFLYHQDFYATGYNLSRAKEVKTLISNRYPELVLPRIYDSQDPILTKEEAKYHQMRNQGLINLVEKIDQGWDPFDSYDKESLTLFITKYESTEKMDIKDFWKQCFDLIPVQSQGKLFYVLIQGLIDVEDRYLLSIAQYDSSFSKLIDARTEIFSYNYPRVGYDSLYPDESFEQLKADNTDQLISSLFLLPLPGQSIFWYFHITYRNHRRHEIIQIGTDGMNAIEQIASSGQKYLQHALTPAFEMLYWDRYKGSAWGDEGWMGYIKIIDPMSGEHISQFFPVRFKREMDQVYRSYHYYRFRLEPPRHPIDILEGKEIDILEAYEEIIYYGSQHRMEKITN